MKTANELQVEAERQAREGLRPGPFKTTCATCAKPFKFGEGGNVFSLAGARDTQIVQMCELCFDELFSDDPRPEP